MVASGGPAPPQTSWGFLGKSQLSLSLSVPMECEPHNSRPSVLRDGGERGRENLWLRALCTRRATPWEEALVGLHLAFLEGATVVEPDTQSEGSWVSSCAL